MKEPPGPSGGGWAAAWGQQAHQTLLYSTHTLAGATSYNRDIQPRGRFQGQWWGSRSKKPFQSQRHHPPDIAVDTREGSWPHLLPVQQAASSKLIGKRAVCVLWNREDCWDSSLLAEACQPVPAPLDLNPLTAMIHGKWKVKSGPAVPQDKRNNASQGDGSSCSYTPKWRTTFLSR